MLTYFLLSIGFALVSTLVMELVKRFQTKRQHQKYLDLLSVSSNPTKKAKTQVSFSQELSKKIDFYPLNVITQHIRHTYDVPKDVNIANLLFIQFGLVFICWNVSGFLKISLIPLLILALLIQIIGAALVLSRRKLVDQLDKAFPQMLESVGNMYHIHPDLKHSFVNSEQLVSDSVTKRFLSEINLFTKVGVPIVQALELMSEKWKYSPLAFMTSSIKIHQATGGDLSKLFRQMALSMRRHQQNTKAMQNVMFQNKVSGFVVCALVPVVLLLSLSLSENYRAVVFHEEFARSLIIGAILWWLVGVAVMWKLLRVRV
jgi:Flp pilus assembly protein TadB